MGLIRGTTWFYSMDLATEAVEQEVDDSTYLERVEQDDSSAQSSVQLAEATQRVTPRKR